MLELEYRPRAQLDKTSIAIYLGHEQQAPKAALEAIKKIDAAIDQARMFPESGSVVPTEETPLSGEYRKVLARPYIILYRHDVKTLTVCRILHERQNLDARTIVKL